MQPPASLKSPYDKTTGTIWCFRWSSNGIEVITISRRYVGVQSADDFIADDSFFSF